jgi:hypothetical protein
MFKYILINIQYYIHMQYVILAYSGTAVAR